MSATLKYLKNSFARQHANPVGEISLAGLRIYVKDPVPDNVHLRDCLETVLGRMPRFLMTGIKSIMIGQYPFLIKRQVEAVFKDGVIYLTNQHDDNYDLISDLIHEIAHAFEETNKDYLYEDKIIENEFLSKREMLYHVLESHNLVTYPISRQDFYNLNYDMKFDNYLYYTIGYEKIGNLANGFFISPYAATCLREYFANAFENFFINDVFLVKKFTPNVYKKLITYLEM